MAFYLKSRREKLVASKQKLFTFVSRPDEFRQEIKLRMMYTDNPFFHTSTLPYQAPAFDQIREEHYLPAFEEGIQQQKKEIQAIADNLETPTFENTLVALEKSGAILSRVTPVFFAISNANTNPVLQDIEEKIAPQLAAQQDAIFLNDKLFQRIKLIYEAKNTLYLDKESARLLDYYYEKFTLAGAELAVDKKKRLSQLNEKEAVLITQFNSKLIAAAKNTFVSVNEKSALEGLSEEEISAAAENAKTKQSNAQYVLGITNTTQQSQLQYLKNRSLRKELFEKAWARTENGDVNDTRDIVLQLAHIRSEKAALLGFKNFAEWTLKDQMAQTSERVEAFLSQLIPPTKKKAASEATKIQRLIDQQNGGFQLEAYDWNYYAEQIRKSEYDLQESEIMPYFELKNVLEKGVFFAAQQLYGITFQPRKDLPVYQEDVSVYELFEEDGTALGLFYFDPYKRDNKSGGAWMDNIVTQSHLLSQRPVIYNVCNYPKPLSGQPCLLTYDDVTTLFHEFGHALHGFFANQQYASLSGTSVARDFVELPSQFNEHWSLHPKVLSNYALHYKTGETMPLALAEKIRKATTFNQGYALSELLGASQLDMHWHTLASNETVSDVDDFEQKALLNTGLNVTQIPPRYRSSYFLHIWGNGYCAGYYAYQWAEMLDNDIYDWFEQHGGLTRENGQHYRDTILSKGNTEDYNDMFFQMTGRKPRIEPMLKHRGLM